MENLPEPAGKDQEQQILLFDPTKRYPVVNSALLENKLEEDPQQQTDLPQPGVELSASLEHLRQWYKAAQQLGKDERYLNRITELAGEVAAGHELPTKAQVAMEHDLALLQAIQTDTPQEGTPYPAPETPAVTLDQLRSWYAAARELNKDAPYLERITEIAQEYKQGKPLSEKALAAMQRDIQAYQSLAVEQ